MLSPASAIRKLARREIQGLATAPRGYNRDLMALAIRRFPFSLRPQPQPKLELGVFLKTGVDHKVMVWIAGGLANGVSPVHSGMFEDLDDLGHYADPGNNTNQGPFTGKNRSYEYDR
ncbi:Protein of unknown function [Pyronema omphalodes CBS 100304]|uniref:Uncharacterized protein n=1 Tax=Pyronema omphalodes (strain CBS 100304) TaxID=1076935 RepID=U4LQF6_PYROM|nr:Protein of unknown function [Pyronema omphalodes CBS 100304]